MSPYHTQLVLLISRVPNSTGTGLEESTVVVSTSPGVGVTCVYGLGRNR
ncbi:hypothetical protein [Desulfobulbus propionicus]|nr:hypothetical protein [Desulfobulbus propionicus]